MFIIVHIITCLLLFILSHVCFCSYYNIMFIIVHVITCLSLLYYFYIVVNMFVLSYSFFPSLFLPCALLSLSSSLSPSLLLSLSLSPFHLSLSLSPHVHHSLSHTLSLSLACELYNLVIENSEFKVFITDSKCVCACVCVCVCIYMHYIYMCTGAYAGGGGRWVNPPPSIFVYVCVLEEPPKKCF